MCKDAFFFDEFPNFLSLLKIIFLGCFKMHLLNGLKKVEPFCRAVNLAKFGKRRVAPDEVNFASRWL